MKKFILVTVILIATSLSAVAADFTSGARGAGIGLPFFVLADDPSGALNNPAGLGFIRGWQSQFMYNRMNDYALGGSNGNPYSGLLSTSFHKPELGTFNISMAQSGVLSADVEAQKTNYFSLSFGREFGEGLSFGSSLKYLKESNYSERSAFDVDFGALYRDKSGLMFGASLENIAKAKLSPAVNGLNETLPRRERVGAGYFHEASTYQAVFGVAGQFEQSGITQDVSTSLFGVGSEWWFNQYGQYSFALRGGYSFGESAAGDFKADYSSPSFGFSVNKKIGFNDLRLDYSWQMHPYETSDGTTPANHYISVSYGWGGVPSYNNAQQEIFLQDVKVAPKKVKVVSATGEELTDDVVEFDANNDIDNDTDFENYDFARYNVDIEVTNISRLDFKRVVFYLKPQQIIQTSTWRLYIFKAKIKEWNRDEIDRWCLKQLDGRGLPPINIAWDGITYDGRLLPKGSYYAVLTAEDSQGERYATKWNKFHIE